MKSKFLPCPFCGEKDELGVSTNIMMKMGGELIESRVSCYMCGSNGGWNSVATDEINIKETNPKYEKCELGAVDKWNTRNGVELKLY